MRIIKSLGICDDEVLYRHVDSLGLPEVFLSSILHLVHSRHVNSWACKIYWASYLEDGALVRISILFFLLITHAGDLSTAAKVLVSCFFFFWSPSRKSIFVKTEARLYLSIHPSIHPSAQHLEYLRDTSGTVLVTEATKCEESATEITSTMSNDPKQASAIQHLTITLNVWM